MNFQAPLELAGKVVKCPRCKQHVRISSLFDDQDHVPDTPGDRPSPTFTPSFRAPVPDRSRQAVSRARSADWLVPLVKPALIVVLLVGVWLVWRGAADDGAGHPRTQSEAIGARTAETVTSADPTLAPATGVTDRVASVFRAMPSMPAEIGIDLVTERMASACEGQYTAWTGDSLISTSSRWLLAWRITPEEESAVTFDGEIRLGPFPDTQIHTTPLTIKLPIGPKNSVCVQLGWPLDDRPHRLRCWVKTDGGVVTALDEVVLGSGDMQTAVEQVSGVRFFAKSGSMKCTAARIYSEKTWRVRPRVPDHQHGMVDNWTGTSSDTPLIPAALIARKHGAQVRFRPFADGSVLDVCLLQSGDVPRAVMAGNGGVKSGHSTGTVIGSVAE